METAAVGLRSSAAVCIRKTVCVEIKVEENTGGGVWYNLYSVNVQLIYKSGDIQIRIHGVSV